MGQAAMRGAVAFQRHAGQAPDQPLARASNAEAGEDRALGVVSEGLRQRGEGLEIDMGGEVGLPRMGERIVWPVLAEGLQSVPL